MERRQKHNNGKTKTYLTVKIKTKLSKNQMGNNTTLGWKKQNPFGGKS
jgi:hypothetical protein